MPHVHNTRWRFWAIGLALVVLAGCAHAGSSFEYCCCLGSESEAAQRAEHMKSLVPGLETEVKPMEFKDEAGTKKIGYAIQVHHPTLVRDEVCAALTGKKCPPDPACP